ncbi:HPr family phosphocarrier protein [Caproiciproducens sp. CPB-2]|uniref:HPr family phosphocarrier protein n=1 Tax=unclassified Caproiciproducens TaxID=2643836 RepID=UPI0023DC5D35|nr:HPr family phosphocarrier protein [Caproiciproducens sp. CPB-2]MDF1494039.1 HPr family phosphocarrier protein [Caproiciproducens sp. CPB-2]
MMTVKILLDSVEKVKKFTASISNEEVDFEIIEGMHIVDAKSIMGIFSIDLTKPLRLNIHSDDRKILDKIKDFLVEE